MNRAILVAELEETLVKMKACAALEQQITHRIHRDSDYAWLITDLEKLISRERVMLKRLETVGR